MSERPQLSPPPAPRAVRISRRAVWAMLAVVALTVFGASLALNQKSSDSAEPAAPPPAPLTETARPSFLERQPFPDSRLGEGQHVPLATPEELRRAQEAGWLDEDLLGETDASDPALPPSDLLTGRPPDPPPVDPRVEAYRRALSATTLLPAPAGLKQRSEEGPDRNGRELSLGGVPDTLPPGLPSVQELLASAPAGSGPEAATPAFEVQPAASSPAGSHALSFQAPAPYTLPAGSTVPLVLETGINSDLAGDLAAQVALDVYDRTHRHVLIPRGSRLFGSYENRVAAGQNRLLIAWTRLVLPNGRSATFPGLPAVSRGGEAGVRGRVNNHLARVFGHAVLLSLVSAGAQLGQPQESATFGQAASSRQVAAAALAQELSTVATEILRRGLAIPPTITVPSGTAFHVYVSTDLVFPEPYRS